MSSCRSCGAPVIWAETVNGKRMPVNRDPSPEGNVILAQEVSGGPVIAYVGAVPIEGGRLSHFVSCPEADRHRRKR